MRITRRLAGSGSLAALAAPAARAQAPARPITFVVPYAAGGNVDITARLVAAAIGSSLGRPIVVDNRSGANGTLGAGIVARAEPDGSTLLVGSNGPVVFAPMAMANPPYRWQEAFAPVSLTSISTNVLLVRQSLPVHSVAELLEYGKRNPGKLNCALSSGTSINTFIAALFQRSTGLDWTTITYRGNAPAINDLVAGNVDFGFAQLTDSAEQIRAGTLRAIAVLGPARSPALPGVPSIGEQGHPSVQGITFSGVLAPAGTPKPMLDTLSAAIRAALARPEVKNRLAAVGSEARGSTPEEFRAMLAGETAKWERAIRELHLTLTE